MRTRSGFTLVETLVVLAIIGIVVALSVGAFMVAPRMARERGTEALIAKLDAKLQQKLGELARSRADVRATGFDTMLAGGSAQRARVIAIARIMRQSFPELFYIDADRVGSTYDYDGDGISGEADEIIAGQWDRMDADGKGTLDQLPSELVAAAVNYRQYFERAFADRENDRKGVPFRDAHTPVTARAECLYMILTNCGQDTAGFNADEIKDTDRDGLLEFVDKFGTPIQFYLWPSYHGAMSLTLPLASDSPKQNPGAESDPDDPSGLLLQADWWGPASYSDARPNFERLFHALTHFVQMLPGSGAGPTLAGWQPKGFKTYPLIVSAGVDVGFGFQCDPAFKGRDGIAGTVDDTDGGSLSYPAIGVIASVGPDGGPGQVNSDDNSNGMIDDSGELGWSGSDDGIPALPSSSAVPSALRRLFFSAALRITDPKTDGFGMDGDNIDNHRLRAR